MTNSMHDLNYRQRIARKLSRGGKYMVKFVNHPEFPCVLEFVARPDGKRPIRYINLSARTDANIIRFV